MSKVTKEMIEAGSKEFQKYINTDRYDPVYPVDEIVRFIYLAMRFTEKDPPPLSEKISVER